MAQDAAAGCLRVSRGDFGHKESEWVASSIRLVDGETALLARVAERIVTAEVIVGEEAGFVKKQKVVFDIPRTVDYRADVEDIAGHLQELMRHPLLLV